MKTAEAVGHFGTQAALAKALKISQASVAEWGEGIPWRRQLELERLTQGKLKHNPEDIPEDLRPFLRKKAAAV